MNTDDDRYWSVDLPGMTKDQATDLLRHARGSGLHGTTVDPNRWLTRHLDIDTVDALLRRLSGGELEPGDDAVLSGLLDDFGDWRDRAQTA